MTYRAIVRYDQDNNIAQLWIDASVEGDTSMLGEDRADPGDSIEGFALRQSDSDLNEGILVDNLMIGGTFNDVLVFVSSTEPTLTLNDAPTSGSTITISPEEANNNATIDFSTTNFTVDTPSSGDGYIKWNIKDTSDDSVVDSGDIFTTGFPPTYPVTGLSAGKTYLLFAELVDNTGTPISPAVTYTLTVIIAEYTVVANLAALRASPIGDDLYYQVSGEVIGTFMQNNRNQKYIQDATAGILIDDPNFNIATVYNIGDGVVNIKGQLSSFNGVLQFLPIEDAPEVPVNSTGNVITPEVVTITELLSNWNNYESELVEIKGATFVGATGNFATGTDYPINDGASDLNFRTNFFDANYIGSLIPTTPRDLVVLVGEFNGTPQVTARDLDDGILRIERDAINGFNLYPNPVTNGKLFINTLSNADKEIQIYNILGKQVLSTKLKGRELNVSKLSSGIYILKILEEGKTATRKMVIK